MTPEYIAKQEAKIDGVLTDAVPAPKAGRIRLESELGS
jgi:hypothetical protein